jgi:hypothetical protein
MRVTPTNSSRIRKSLKPLIEDQNSLICTQKVLNKAKTIRSLVGGDIKQYIRFISEKNLEEEHVDDILDFYLSYD